jgi:hypothetical protein
MCISIRHWRLRFCRLARGAWLRARRRSCAVCSGMGGSAKDRRSHHPRRNLFSSATHFPLKLYSNWINSGRAKPTPVCRFGSPSPWAWRRQFDGSYHGFGPQPRHPDVAAGPMVGERRKRSKDPTLLKDLKALVEPTTRGDPMRPLLWTCRSLRNSRQGGGKAGAQSLSHRWT